MVDTDGNPLPANDADPLTVRFIRQVLDLEKPDLVVLTGDQMHHSITDSQTALFKVVAPMIEREIPWAAVFGNHDTEGEFILSRECSSSFSGFKLEYQTSLALNLSATLSLLWRTDHTSIENHNGSQVWHLANV